MASLTLLPLSRLANKATAPSVIIRPCIAPGFRDTWAGQSGSPLQDVAAGLGWGPVTVPLDEPLLVVVLHERTDGAARPLEAREVVQVEALLLQRPEPSLHDPVASRFADVDRAGPDVEPRELAGESLGGVLRAPVVPKPESLGDLRLIAPEAPEDTLMNGL